METVQISIRKLLLQLQKHHFHSILKPNDVYHQSIYIYIFTFILWDMKEKNYKNYYN